MRSLSVDPFRAEATKALAAALESLPTEYKRKLFWNHYVHPYGSQIMVEVLATAAYKELEEKYSR
jgi:hypothetical protein